MSVIERDPLGAAIGDPIVRRQVQIRRLKLSLAACREAGSTGDALKTVLISAEAERDDSTLREVLEGELDLSAEFAGSSLRRTILLERDRVKQHGSFLAQDAVRAARAGDGVTAREQLYFHDAWLNRRRRIAKEEIEQWTVTDRDVSARVETILELAGPKAALYELRGWTPREVSLRVAFILIPQLIAAGKVHHIKALLKEHLPPGPWDLLLWVPLAMAGESVNGLSMEKALKRIRRPFIPDAGASIISYSGNGWQQRLLDTFMTACELAFKLGLNRQIILTALGRILEVLEGKQNRRLFAMDSVRIDGLFRCWLLSEAIAGRALNADQFIAYLKAVNPEPEPKKQPGAKRPKKRTGTSRPDNQEDERLYGKIRALFRVYSTRLEILFAAREGHPVTIEQLDRIGSIDSYELDYDHDGTYLRDTAAKSVMALLIISNIQASVLVERTSKLSQGRFGDSLASRRRELWAQACLRISEADKLLQLIARAAEEIKGLRAASSEKLGAIIHLSRLILHVSRHDAESLFNDALSIAKEIDREAFDQIDFVSVLAERACIKEQPDRKAIAADFFAFISAAAERLSGQGGFPWGSAVRALTCMDDATALAGVCRWADDGTIGLNDTLDRFTLTALRRGIISPQTAVSLALLVGGSDRDLQKELVSRAVVEPQKYKEVIEGLAQDVLLLSPQDARLSLGQEIVDQISSNDYPDCKWLAHLKDTIAFLRHIKDNKRRETTTIPPEKAPLLGNNNVLPKQFVFDPQGRSFVTADSITQVLQEAEASGLPHWKLDLLRKMKEVSSSPRERVPFLNALAEVPDDFIRSTDRIEIIRETVAVWKGTPAVDRWCRESLPPVLVTNFYGVTRWLKEGQSALHELLDHVGLSSEGRLNIILSGVAQAGEALDSRTLFGVAEEIGRAFNADESGASMRWYTRRLWARLTAEDQALHSLKEVPIDGIEAISRFLFALMSDIDTRVRWKAAHALRRLAKLGCFDIVKATVLEASRIKDDAFRDPRGPYYFLAAKLWLAISLYRISAETPEAISFCKAEILDLATSPELPHVGIREYAKRTLLQLASSGAILLTSSEKEQVDRVNSALKGKTAKKRGYHRSSGLARDGKQRFKFNEMDTTRYWYEDILRFFPTVSQGQVLEIAERWILDNWGADPEANWWDKEPRKARYEERRYRLWSHDHGSLPTIERYGTHLEWNAMHCVVGELLRTHRISEEGDDYFGSFSHWLGRVLPTEPPEWLSDNRGPTPLESRLWRDNERTDGGWLRNIRRDEYLTEVGIQYPIFDGWIVIGAHYTAHFPKRETIIAINSALVSPETAPALVRALQTASDPWDFRIPDEGDDLEIDAPPYRLMGWVPSIEGDARFDEKDPFRYGVGQIRTGPGRQLTKVLNLLPKVGTYRTWIASDTGENALIYEAWCDEPPPEEDYYQRRTRSNGWRLWARADLMRHFLSHEGWKLILEVQIDRQLRNEYGRSYERDTKKKRHEKILLLGADGSVTDAGGRIGSWAGLSQGVGP